MSICRARLRRKNSNALTLRMSVFMPRLNCSVSTAGSGSEFQTVGITITDYNMISHFLLARHGIACFRASVFANCQLGRSIRSAVADAWHNYVRVPGARWNQPTRRYHGDVDADRQHHLVRFDLFIDCPAPCHVSCQNATPSSTAVAAYSDCRHRRANASGSRAGVEGVPLPHSSSHERQQFFSSDVSVFAPVFCAFTKLNPIQSVILSNHEWPSSTFCRFTVPYKTVDLDESTIRHAAYNVHGSSCNVTAEFCTTKY